MNTDDVCLCATPDFKPTPTQPGGSRWPICQRCGGWSLQPIAQFLRALASGEYAPDLVPGAARHHLRLIEKRGTQGMTATAMNAVLRAVRKFHRNMQQAQSSVQAANIADALMTTLNTIKGFNSK